MDATLVNFAGAGFATIATGMNIDVPEGAIASGLSLVRHLAQAGAADADTGDVSDFVAETAQNIIGNWPRGQIPLSVIGDVLDAMPAIMDTHRPDASLIVSALVSAGIANKIDGSGADMPGRRLAGDIVLKARADETFARLGVNESLAFFVLERLFTGMLSRRPFIEANREAFANFFDSGMWQQQALSTLAEAPPPQTIGQEANWDDAMDKALALASAAEKSGKDADFERALAAFTKVAALLPRDVSPSHWAQAERAHSRTTIALAERASDAPQAWSALKVLDQVLSVHTKEAAPRDWALAQIDVANGLCLLGELERDDVLLETAIATFESVQAVAIRDDMPESWAAATSGLGQAKWTLGRRCQDRNTLSEAYAHKITALDEFEALGMWEAANRVRAELRDLDSELDRLPEVARAVGIA